MKYRFTTLLLILIISTGVFAQPPETVYEGTVITTGFRQSILSPDYGPHPIGFDFEFFGNTYSQFWVSVNGLILFDKPSDVDLYNTEATIPSAGGPDNFIAPFWDNLSILDGGNIMYKTIGAANNHKCIIQFKNMGFDPIISPFGTFSIILYEETNVIQVQYRLILDPYSPQSHGESATIGIENADGTKGALYAFHQGDAVYSEDAISFTPSPSDPESYTIDPATLYDGVFLTTNLSLPDPAVVNLISPAEDAVVGADVSFQWAAADNASAYYFVMDNNPDLSSAKYTDVGLNLSYDTTNLSLDETYYWTVFSYNATSFTWSEVIRFFTVSSPPLAAVPQTIWTEQGQDKTIKLNYTGGDASAKTAIITTLPAQGQLFQYDGGIRGPEITSVPATVTDPARNIIYAATGNTGTAAGNFNFKMNDDTGDSPEAKITVNVSPAGIPNVLYTAKNKDFAEIQFDRKMANPTGKEDQFELLVNGSPAVIDSLTLKEGDPYSIILHLATHLTDEETVLLSYTPGDISSLTGGYLLTITDEPVNLLAQIIDFSQSLDRTFDESPFRLTATVNSGLPLTYTSSNTSVASISGGVYLNFRALGTSEIRARQTGNSTYAPVNYYKTLTVSKGDQTITFEALEDKNFGDPDFTLTATATSGLTVTFSSSNPSVATVEGNTVHITGGGTTTITASQAGNAWWNAAEPVDQTFSVSKTDQTITFDPIPDKTYGDADFDPGATASSGLPITYSSDNENVAVIEDNMIHITGTGSAVITASQAGNDTYNPAEDVTQTLTVGKADQTIDITVYPNEILLYDTHTLSATASSGLPVLFESLNTAVATVSGDLFTAVGTGSVQIRAYNDGDDNYEPAEAFATFYVYSTHSNIMNLFTPNNDGINDYWELTLPISAGRCDVRIFNRHGKQVFADDNYDNLWDGTSNGNPLPEGAYYYVIKTENSGTIKGTVNLVR